MGIIHKWPDRQPEVDTKSVGVSFVDVLFALVIAKVLEPFGAVDHLTGPGVMHLVVAGVLALTSWIGYHNSLNRPKYFIRFPNLPLLQFILDIGMVVVYWLTAATAEGKLPPASPRPSAVPETVLVAIAFAMYVAWDVVALCIRNNDRYTRRSMSEDVPARRSVTRYCLLVALVLVGLAVHQTHQSAPSVYAIDGLIVALLIVFRVLKEYVTPGDVGLSNEERAQREVERGQLSDG